MPYPSGLSRGDTPPREILATGTGKRGIPALKAAQVARSRCPFHIDEGAPFSARAATMSLDVVRASDLPPGPLKFPKDYDRSLMTEDLPRAQPTLAHPTSAAGMPVPWQHLHKPEMAEIPKAKPKTHYPDVHPERPRDLSLHTEDIELAQPTKLGRNCQGRMRADGALDPLVPMYQFASSAAAPPPTNRWSGRCTLDISDIEGTSPSAPIPVRQHYGNPLKVEEEFRSRGACASSANPLEQDAWRLGRPPVPGDPRPACLTPRHGLGRLQGRNTHPLEPTYLVPQPCEAPGTSLHARWAEEKWTMGKALPATEHQEIGPVPGSVPRIKSRDNGEPTLSLETRDIAGARPVHRVGNLPYTIYGPSGNRPPMNSSLNSSDIEGAQAGTRPRGPRSTHRASRLAASGTASLSLGGGAQVEPLSDVTAIAVPTGGLCGSSYPFAAASTVTPREAMGTPRSGSADFVTGFPSRGAFPLHEGITVA